MVVRQRRSTTRMRREYVSRWRGRKTRINNERNLVRIIYIFLSVPEASDCNLSCFGTLRDWFQFQTLVGHPSHRPTSWQTGPIAYIQLVGIMHNVRSTSLLTRSSANL
jgi:hypothetical protein